MFTIDIMLRQTPLPLSIQKKTEEDAEATYQQLVAAMNQPDPHKVEISCDRDAGKKITVLSNQLIAVQVSQKSGSAATGKVPGFASLLQ